MVADFRRRLWVSLVLTLPVLTTSHMIQQFLGLRDALAFPGDRYVGFGFASAVYFYGGWPFFTGFVDEVRARLPGMMTLVALAITVAYAYSTLVVFGLPGDVFFWETATLIDIMLLGHWLEMRSVLGASRALEQLVRLLPADAHRLRPDEGGGSRTCRWPRSGRAIACSSSRASGSPPTARSATAGRRWTRPCSPASPGPSRKARAMR